MAQAATDDAEEKAEPAGDSEERTTPPRFPHGHKSCEPASAAGADQAAQPPSRPPPRQFLRSAITEALNVVPGCLRTPAVRALSGAVAVHSERSLSDSGLAQSGDRAAGVSPEGRLRRGRMDWCGGSLEGRRPPTPPDGRGYGTRSKQGQASDGQECATSDSRTGARGGCAGPRGRGWGGGRRCSRSEAG